MRELLMIAYLFPPLGGGGVQRSVSFARELLPLGWRATVICAGPDALYWARDPSLAARLPPEVEVHPVLEGLAGRGARGLRRLVPRPLRPGFDRAAFFPDRQITWAPRAIATAERLLERRRFDAVYSTGSPWSDHLVGARAAARAGLPWVADYRDPWTQNQTFRAASPVHAGLHRALEAALHRRADLVVANTELNLRRLVARFPWTAGRAIALPNGFDEDDFAALPPAAWPAERAWLSYAGSFYPGYGPERFLDLFSRAVEGEPGLAARLGLRFLGKTALASALSTLPAEVAREELGYLPHREALAALSSAHATLLLLPPSREPSGWVPQKLYVYLRLGRPVLALCPPGEAADIVRAAGGGNLVLDPEDPSAPLALRGWLARLAGGALVGLRPAPDVVARFDRSRVARRLASALDALVEGRPVEV